MRGKWMLPIALAALLVAGTAATVVAAGKEPVRIGAVFSVTGPPAFLGDPEKKTAEMVAEEINKAGGILGRPVELIVLDDEGDATKAVTAFDRLVKKDKVVAVIGPSTSGSTLAIVPKAKDAKVPLVSCAAARKIVDPVDPWIFKTPQSDFLAVRKIYQHMKAQGIAKVAIISASDAYGAAGREELKNLGSQFGITVVADEVFGPKDTDMTAQLTKIKGTEAQAVVCWGTNPGPAAVARNRSQLGMKTPLYMSHGVESKKFIELAGKENAEGILLPAGHLAVLDHLPAGAPGQKVLAAYRKGYQAKQAAEPSAFGGYAHDALRLVAEAAKLGKGTTPEAIRAGLEKVKGFQGVTGEYNFSATDHNGLTEAAFVMVRIADGKFELIDKITAAPPKKAPASKGGKKK